MVELFVHSSLKFQTFFDDPSEMTATSKMHQSIQYPEHSILRAERAMRCSPFHLELFTNMVSQSVALNQIAQTAGVQNAYTTQPLSELRAESELLWLIQVGLLRREVDGQGLTDSFRLTPLGRQLVAKWQNQSKSAHYAPTWSDRLSNILTRWLRLPF
ncbi:hypothetical protein OsccyDRAFT_4781 [Leptolyngbyaceae cyanobacterium JSC-12]|nr:hypothetical protein OsccyDRAFT_4781 [Leptolyngbyaceae cyanobacterium JSC-12]